MRDGIPLRFIGGPLNGQRKFFTPETAYEGAYYRTEVRKRLRYPGYFCGDMPEDGTVKLYEYKVKVIRTGFGLEDIKYLGPTSTTVDEDIKKRFAP